MPPPWRERLRRKDWKLGRESSESLISEDSQVSTTQIISGECKEQRADNSSNLGRRLQELKKKSFKDFEEVDVELIGLETVCLKEVELANRLWVEEKLLGWETDERGI